MLMGGGVEQNCFRSSKSLWAPSLPILQWGCARGTATMNHAYRNSCLQSGAELFPSTVTLCSDVRTVAKHVCLASCACDSERPHAYVCSPSCARMTVCMRVCARAHPFVHLETRLRFVMATFWCCPVLRLARNVHGALVRLRFLLQ